jgi:hypothetical protein
MNVVTADAKLSSDSYNVHLFTDHLTVTFGEPDYD